MASKKRKASAQRDVLGRFLSRDQIKRRAARAARAAQARKRPRDERGHFLSNQEIEKRRRAAQRKRDRERKKKRRAAVGKRPKPKRKKVEKPRRPKPKRKKSRRPAPKPKPKREPKKPKKRPRPKAPRLSREDRERSDEWRSYFRELLEDACRVLELDGYGCEWSVRQNQDGSVDGQIRLEVETDEVAAHAAAIDLENAASWARPGYWITLAAVVDAEKAVAEGYDYPIGASGEHVMEAMWPVKSVNAATLFLEFRERYLPHVVDSVTGIILRVNWNPEKKQSMRIR